MALRNILQKGDETLTKKSRPVADFNERLHVLLDDMRETLTDAEGLGLAAPQVGVLRRAVLVLDLDRAAGDQVIELVNPEIVECGGQQEGAEGCLSVPGYIGVVTRPMRVKVRAQNRNGNTFEIEAEGLTARAIAHELDHLEGMLYTSLAKEVITLEQYAERLEESEKG